MKNHHANKLLQLMMIDDSPRGVMTRHNHQARWVIPTTRIPLAEQRKWALSRIGKLWKGHKSELKEKHYNPNTTKEDLLQLSLPKVDDTQFHGLELSKDNKERHGKQTKQHTLKSRSLARTTNIIAKMKQLMTEGSRLRGNDIEGGILWQPNDTFRQVISAERGGCVRGVGFGPTPSGNRVRSMDDSTPPPTSTATDQRVIELSTQVEEMKEKCDHYDAEMRLIWRVLTSLCPSFPSMSMDGDGDSAVDI
nr:hypothetical protein CFP56_57446 [Quercus suber]